jgi:ribosomal protein L19E
MHGQWHKLLAIAMVKLGQDHVIITPEDIEKVSAAGTNITVQELTDGIHLRIVDDETAMKLARKHGGISNANDN